MFFQPTERIRWIGLWAKWGNEIKMTLLGTAGTLLAVSWLLASTTSMIPAVAPRHDPSPPIATLPLQVRTMPPTRRRVAADPESMLPHFKGTRFWLSGQVNFIFQTHPDFHADYSGKNSLSPDYEKATSRVMTLYTGVRLNNSTEFLVDIEEAGARRSAPALASRGIRIWTSCAIRY